MAWLRKTGVRIKPREISVLIATLLAIPLGWGGITGLYVWFSPYIMLNSVFVLKSVVWFNIFAFIVLSFAIFKKRWFCHHLCPVGWGCDLISSCSFRKKYSLKRVPSLGKGLVVLSLAAALFGFPLFVLLDPMSIFNGFFTIFSIEKLNVVTVLSLLGLPVLWLAHLLFPGFWCAKVCPLGALQDSVFELKKLVKIFRRGEEIVKVSKGRRLFLMSGAGIVSGIVLPRFFKPAKKEYLRPPGSVPELLFNILCVRCGNCIKSCPSEILVHRTEASDTTSWMVPEVRFVEGYCVENCNLCSQVCPSGAITLFSPDAKKQLTIGLAKVIKPDSCLLLQNKECDLCKKACSCDAVIIDINNKVPFVVEKKCVGCGACAVVCPSVVFKIIPT